VEIKSLPCLSSDKKSGIDEVNANEIDLAIDNDDFEIN